jgi:hypothetical protein
MPRPRTPGRDGALAAKHQCRPNTTHTIIPSATRPAKPSLLTRWQGHDKKASRTDQLDTTSRGPNSPDWPRLVSWKTGGKIVPTAH